jgi:hypothetical protein
MTRWLWVIAVSALAVCGSTVRAGGPPVVLAVLDRVVLEPDMANPPRVQLWGTFALGRGKGAYQAPVWGCLYYQVKQGKEKDCLQEWSELRKLAGKREVVGFGFCHSPEQAGKIRRGIAGNDVPDVYPLGAVYVVTRAEDWQAIDEKAIKGLLKTPSPPTPATETKRGKEPGRTP